MTRMTSLTDSSGHLYPTPFKFMHMKKDTYICKCLFLYQQLVPPWILPDTFILLPFKFMHAKRTHISASPFPLSAASYPPGPLPAKYFRRL